MVRTTQPTHNVTHASGYEANLYIASSLQEKLDSSNPAVFRGARDSVCIAFRKACEKKYPNFPLGRISWHSLTMAPLDHLNDVGCACEDDCKMCDIGYHSRCRDCPMA